MEMVMEQCMYDMVLVPHGSSPLILLTKARRCFARYGSDLGHSALTHTRSHAHAAALTTPSALPGLHTPLRSSETRADQLLEPNHKGVFRDRKVLRPILLRTHRDRAYLFTDDLDDCT
jgi:hypothetical protein